MTIDFRLDDLLLAIDEGDLDLARFHDAPCPVEVVDLVLAQQKRDAVDIALNAFILEGEHGGKVELGLDLDAHAGEGVGGFSVTLARVQQRLRRNAADIEAGASVGRALLDHGDLHAELACADGADIAAGPRADDDKVVSHVGSLSPYCSGVSVSSPCPLSQSPVRLPSSASA